MSRRSPRIRVRFAATVQIAGVDHTLVCHTRDISFGGCYLDTAEEMAEGEEVAMAVMDNVTGEVVEVVGHVSRINVEGRNRGVGVVLDGPPPEWLAMVERYESAGEPPRIGQRLAILVVGRGENRRGALALYISSGWDVRFADDLATATEALQGRKLDAVIVEVSSTEDDWRQLLALALSKQPLAHRFVRGPRAVLQAKIGRYNTDPLVEQFVDADQGIEALVEALSANMHASGSADCGPPDPITGARILRAAAAAAALTRVLEQAGRARALVAFDLDSTLLYNAPRQARIMREYGTDYGLDVLTRSRAHHWSGWDARIAMRNLGLGEELIAEHHDRFKEYWRARFFTSEYCVEDEAAPGAVRYVNSILHEGANVFYVTGRPEAMRKGTVATLSRLGFPAPDDRRTCLLMKPDSSEHDDEYKMRTYRLLGDFGEVVAAFDNEPTHINGYKQFFPNADCIHLATDHSMREVSISEGIVSIADFSAFAPERLDNPTR